MRFIPKCHWLPFLVCASLGRGLACFGRRRRGDDGRPTIVPCRISRPRSSSIAPTSSNNAFVRSCCSSQWRKFSTVVASGTDATVRSIPAKPQPGYRKANAQRPSASPYHCCKSRAAASVPARPAAGCVRPSIKRRRRSTSRTHGTTCSISAKTVPPCLLFLPAYSACEKLPCRCTPPSFGRPGPADLPDASACRRIFQCFPKSSSVYSYAPSSVSMSCRPRC